MKRSHMLLLKANTEWIEKHEAGHTSAPQPLGPAPQEPFKEACGRWHAQLVIVPLVIKLASDNFVQGKCDTENHLDYMTNG